MPNLAKSLADSSESTQVVGPASSTDNAAARFDGTTGKLLQNSLVTISDAGSIALPAAQTVDGRDVSVDGAALDTAVTNIAANTALIGTGPIAAHGTLGPVATNLTDAVNELAALSAHRAVHGYFRPAAASAALAAVGMPSFVAGAGTASAGPLADTNYLTRRQRVLMTSAGSAGSGGVAQSVTPTLIRNLGFMWQATFGYETLSATCRTFVGISNNFGLSDPTTGLNLLGVGSVGGSGSTLNVYVNDGSGAASAVSLGASFPVSVGACYTAWFGCASGASTIYYRVQRLDTPASATGSLTSNLPTAGSFVGYPQFQLQNNTDAAAVVLAVISWDQWSML